MAHGHDPYTTGPSALGWGPTLAAVDPSWRNEPSPYGPLATLAEHLSVMLGGGTALGAVILLRLFAIGSVIAIGVLAVRLAGPERSGTALALTILNPLMLMHVVGGVHFEGLMCALLLMLGIRFYLHHRASAAQVTSGRVNVAKRADAQKGSHP